MRDYYVQRASAGLIVSECTQVSDQGHGIINAPGIHRADQVEGWRLVVDAVHDAGGRIYNQLWHCGRSGHPDMRGGEPVVGPSPIAAAGEFFLPTGRVPYPVPRELAANEIQFDRPGGAHVCPGFPTERVPAPRTYLDLQSPKG